MKNRKIFLLLCFVAFLTGCQANYRAVINSNNSITETVTVKASNDTEYNKVMNWTGFPLEKNIADFYDNYFDHFSSNREKVSGVSYYNNEFNDSTRTMIAKNNFSFNEHMNSSLIKNCFNYYNILPDIDNSSLVAFSTSTGLICSFSNFSVQVTSPYKFTEANSKQYDASTNTYTWNITDSNKESVSINFVIDFKNRYNSNNNTNNNSNNNSNNNTNNNGSNSNTNNNSNNNSNNNANNNGSNNSANTDNKNENDTTSKKYLIPVIIVVGISLFLILIVYIFIKRNKEASQL